MEFSGESKEAPVILTVPKTDGKLVRFRPEESLPFRLFPRF
jgi:hypothetical protein